MLRNIKGGRSLEDLTMYVLKDLSATLQNPVNYLLNRSAIMSYVSWLLNEGLVEIGVSENKLVVSSV